MEEFSRILEINNKILDKRFVEKASCEELKGLSDRFEISEITNLSLEYFITEHSCIMGAYMLECRLISHVVKFEIEDTDESMDINEQFDVVLLTEEMARNNYEDLKDFDIEIFGEERKVDVGEIAAQYLSLCIFM